MARGNTLPDRLCHKHKEGKGSMHEKRGWGRWMHDGLDACMRKKEQKVSRENVMDASGSSVLDQKKPWGL